MKTAQNITLVILAMAVIVLLSREFGGREKNDGALKPTIAASKSPDTASRPVEAKIDKKSFRDAYDIPVGQENFQKIVAYIEKHGFVVPVDGVPCGRQYTFFDKSGNRHAMIVTRRDKASNPSINGEVTAVSVWAYYQGIKDLEHFFGYGISAEKCYSLEGEESVIGKHAPAIRSGYLEFLEKVKKQPG